LSITTNRKSWVVANDLGGGPAAGYFTLRPARSGSEPDGGISDVQTCRDAAAPGSYSWAFVAHSFCCRAEYHFLPT
jgi:hypothetical protein